MQLRRIIMSALVVFCVGSIALATSFTWTGGGADDDWDTCENWGSNGIVCYPSSSRDDATIPTTTSPPWLVDLTDETIDDLTITEDTTFGDADGNDPTLRVDSVTITGATITIHYGATITTLPS